MERGVYMTKMKGGAERMARGTDNYERGSYGGSWANWYEGTFKCGGFQSRDMICVQELDAKFERYQNAFDREEREKLAAEIQRDILENYYSCRCSGMPLSMRLARESKRRSGRTCFQQSPPRYAYPWEDIELKA